MSNDGRIEGDEPTKKQNQDGNQPRTTKSRRHVLTSLGSAGLLTAVGIPGAVAAESSQTNPFDPSKEREVIDYIEWLDKQDDVPARFESLTQEQQDAIADTMLDVTWDLRGGASTQGGGASTLANYQTEDYEDAAVASVGGGTTEYIFEHRIDWEYDLSDYRSITSTLDPRPVGALAEYVEGSAEVDAEVRQSNYFIQRAKAEFELVLVGRQVTSELDLRGDIEGDGETVKKTAPL